MCIRDRSACGSSGLSRNVVSDKFVQFANSCICAVVKPSPSTTTARGLPRKAVSENTSHWINRLCISCKPCMLRLKSVVPFLKKHSYFPIQKPAKIRPSKSSDVNSPVISLSTCCASRKSSAASSGLALTPNCSNPFRINSRARLNAST